MLASKMDYANCFVSMGQQSQGIGNIQVNRHRIMVVLDFWYYIFLGIHIPNQGFSQMLRL